MNNLFNSDKEEDDQMEYSPRLKVTRVNEPAVDLDFSAHQRPALDLTPSSPCPSPSYSTYSNFSNHSTHSAYSNMNLFYPNNSNQILNNQQLYFYPQETNFIPSYVQPQEDNELVNKFKKMSIDSIVDLSRENTSDTIANMSLMANTTGICNVDQNFGKFISLIDKFIKLGEDVLKLYEKAKHNKELCGFLLNRCNYAMVAVRDLNIRKTENAEFFFKEENLRLLEEFIKCMEKIKKFVSRISKLRKLIKYFATCNIEQDFNDIILEFDGYMRSLNFSFVVQSKDEISKMRNLIRQIKDVLVNVYGAPDGKKQLLEFSNRMDRLIKSIDFQTKNMIEDSSELEANEPLLDGKKYQRTYMHTKKIEKRTLYTECEDFCFKEFSNNHYFPDQPQIEIRRQVNILKKLKGSDHIIRFFGVALDDSKFYLVTEWIEYGNLYEYYMRYKEMNQMIDWNTKIRFALDICRGVAYLHECKILHHDIQSTNVLVNIDHKVKIANFGFRKNFSDNNVRNVSQNLENIRYMAPEKLLFDNDDVKKKKVSYDAKCEIYSVGTLLWEIAELTKPHSDLNNANLLVSIRKRVNDRYSLPFSEDVPIEWKILVAGAMEYEPSWRLNISDICREFFNLGKKYKPEFISYDSTTDCAFEDPNEHMIIGDDDNRPSNNTIILTVDDAVREHKSKNGNKLLAWESFKYHSSTNLEAKYWLGYYYYHDEKIPELQQIDKKVRIKTAVELFKETADKGNPSAQLRYGICLWKGDGFDANSSEALRYLESAAKLGNSAAMYITGKAYWNGGNGVEKDMIQGAEYLKRAALSNHPKAKEMCIENNIDYNI